jgi:hypothetical protein
MSLTPGPPPADRQHAPRRPRLLRICFAIFTFEVGLFLLVFPWRDSWTFNYFQGSNQWLEYVWDNPYFRGAFSGLGLVNIYLAILELLRIFRRKS